MKKSVTFTDNELRLLAGILRNRYHEHIAINRKNKKPLEDDTTENLLRMIEKISHALYHKGD